MSHRVLAVLLLFPLTAQAAVLCPASRDGRALQNVQMYDGPLAEMAILRPEQRGRRVWWEVGYIRKAGRQAYLVCAYGHRNTPDPEIEVPAGVRECSFTMTQDDRNAGAVECR